MIHTWKEKLVKSAIIMLTQVNYIEERYNEEKYVVYGEDLKKISSIILNRVHESEYGESICSINKDIAWSIYETIEDSIGILWANIFEHEFSKEICTIHHAIERTKEIISEEVYATQKDEELIKEYVEKCSQHTEKKFDISEIISNLHEGVFKEKLNDKKYDSWIEGQCVLSVILFFQSLS